MNTVHNIIGPAGDDGDKLKAAGDLFFSIADDLWSLKAFIGATSDDQGTEELMSRVVAAEALVAQIGQRADDAAQRLGSVAVADTWAGSPRDRELLAALGPRKRRPAP
ncbi:MAG: hypothetical protein KF863_10700 [Rubrivivax sp.]|nr:hypothetical protein [Rubrivivax sp.]